MNGKCRDLVADTVRYKGSCHSFFLDLKAWRKFQSKVELNWTKVRFNKENRKEVPKERGIYVFSVALSPSFLPEHGYMLYMGITGDSSAATLYSRFGQYLLERHRRSGRPKVCLMLEQWEDDLFFSFVPLSDRRLSLCKLENEFLSAVIPPVNERDFKAKISNARRAAF